MVTIFPVITSKSPNIIQFTGVLSDDCAIDVKLPFIPSMHPSVDVRIELEVIPSSHFMFSNNQKKISELFQQVKHNDIVTKKFRLKKRSGFAGNPILIINVNVVSDANVNGGSTSVNPWPYL